MFLINLDYDRLLWQEDRYILTYNDDPTVLQNSEQTAIEEIKSYLRAYRFGSFDFDRIFINISQYDNTSNYVEGDTVWDNVLLPNSQTEFGVYVCLQSNNNTSLLDTSYWLKGDPRNQLLVMYLIDIIVYHLFAHIMPNSIPEIRIDRYKRAIKWLEDIRDGKVDSNLPIITPEPSEESATAQTAYTNGKRKNYRW